MTDKKLGPDNIASNALKVATKRDEQVEKDNRIPTFTSEEWAAFQALLRNPEACAKVLEVENRKDPSASDKMRFIALVEIETAMAIVDCVTLAGDEILQQQGGVTYRKTSSAPERPSAYRADRWRSQCRSASRCTRRGPRCAPEVRITVGVFHQFGFSLRQHRLTHVSSTLQFLIYADIHGDESRSAGVASGQLEVNGLQCDLAAR